MQQVVEQATMTTTTTAQDTSWRNSISFPCSSTKLITLLLLYTLQATCTLAQSHNDVMPQQYQHNNILHFVVPENAPNNTWIGTIRSADGQIPSMVVPLPQTPEQERLAALNINFSNGDLTTNSILDREHRDQYHFIAIVSHPFAEIKCQVTVRDVNDNVPMFLMPSAQETNVVIEMPEGQRGVRKALPLAVDFDTPLFGIKEFRIVSGNTPSGMFQLVEHEAPVRSTLPQYGNLPDDSVALLAAGADNPQLMQQLAQQATVLIPSQPVMQSTSLASSSMGQSSASSSTASAVPSPLITASTGASSSTGQGNIASNSIPQVPTQSKFLIDLEVSQPLDRENQSSYQLIVEAIDGGQPPLMGRLVVNVSVQDINDNDPVFTRKLYECYHKEDLAKNAVIQRVQAYDADLDSNGQISYFIKRHSSSSQLTTNSINSTSSDSNEVASGRYSASNSNGININNSNSKQRPQQQQQQGATGNGNKLRQQGSGNMDLYDNSAASFPSSQQQQDTSSAYRNRQAVSPAPEQLFDIEPNKGEIYLLNQLDFETDQWHELLIEARDHGKPSRSSFTTVKIHVIDVNDDPIPQRLLEDRKAISSFASSDSKSDQAARIGGNDFVDSLSQPAFNFQNFNLTYWLAQMNSSSLFAIVLIGLFAVAFSVCLVKIKSRQPESDYNDTAGLTLASNNGQTKSSPNHSASNVEHPSGGGGLDGIHHRHHDHQRRVNASFGGSTGLFGTPNGKLSRYPYISDSSNLYHNPYPQQRSRHHSSTSHHMPPDSPTDHQMAVGQGSRGGTMTLLNHHHHRHHHLPLLSHSPPSHHPLEHHQFSGPNHTTSSLTYAHHSSRAALLHQAHHHQSSHQLSSVHQGLVSHNNKDGTMNSVGTHHSAHPPSGSPTHSSGLPPNMHEHGHHGHNPLLPSLPTSNQSNQLPPTPCHNMSHGSVFAWPPQGPGSTIGCFPGPNGLHVTPGSTMDSCGTPAAGVSAQPLDRCFDLGDSSQLVYSHDWYSSYNWDYLADWTPDYHTLMPLLQAETSGY